MKGWITVDPGGIETKRELADWVERGGRFAGTLPGKG